MKTDDVSVLYTLYIPTNYHQENYRSLTIFFIKALKIKVLCLLKLYTKYELLNRRVNHMQLRILNRTKFLKF